MIGGARPALFISSTPMKKSRALSRFPQIEWLEARIAPAAVFTYADVDGDLVTVKTSKGTNDDLKSIVMPYLAVKGLGFGSAAD